ncbi:MAG: DNA-formamidopyrimidine glycosylase, partial [Firmicutes bacterium]|nr:DNA-formamidopyrimidine glycosylase [Bacillota bacterium]
MPELPEIETVRRVVCPQIAGARIVSASVDREKIVGHPSVGEFVRKLEGRTVVSDG